MQKRKFFFLILPLMMMLGCCNRAFAQEEPTVEQVQIARQAVAALHASDPFDKFLVIAARNLKMQFDTQAPQLSDFISKTVNNVALAMAQRRDELENAVARAYARQFSVEDLQAITRFYLSPTGKKFLARAPAATAEAFNAFQAWSEKINKDMTQEVQKALEAKRKEISEKKNITTPQAPK